MSNSKSRPQPIRVCMLAPDCRTPKSEAKIPCSSPWVTGWVTGRLPGAGRLHPLHLDHVNQRSKMVATGEGGDTRSIIQGISNNPTFTTHHPALCGRWAATPTLLTVRIDFQVPSSSHRKLRIRSQEA